MKIDVRMNALNHFMTIEKYRTITKLLNAENLKPLKAKNERTQMFMRT